MLPFLPGSLSPWPCLYLLLIIDTFFYLGLTDENFKLKTLLLWEQCVDAYRLFILWTMENEDCW